MGLDNWNFFAIMPVGAVYQLATHHTSIDCQQRWSLSSMVVSLIIEL